MYLSGDDGVPQPSSSQNRSDHPKARDIMSTLLALLFPSNRESSMELALVPMIKNCPFAYMFRDQAHDSNIQIWPREADSANNCFNIAQLPSFRTLKEFFDAKTRHTSHNDNSRVQLCARANNQ